MAQIDSDFWRRVGQAAPGMFDVGAGLYGMSAGQSEANKRIGGITAAGGPAATASQTALTRAGSMDPRAAGQEWLGGQRNLLAAGDAADEAALMRMLNTTGMMGASSYGVQGPGAANVSQNPMAAAYYAQRGNRDARMAAEAQDRGESQIDRMLGRSSKLQSQSAAAQRAARENAMLRPSKAAAGTELIRGVGGLLRDPNIRSGVGGLFGSGANWLRNTFGGGGGDFGIGGLDFSGLNFDDMTLDFF